MQVTRYNAVVQIISDAGCHIIFSFAFLVSTSKDWKSNMSFLNFFEKLHETVRETPNIVLWNICEKLALQKIRSIVTDTMPCLLKLLHFRTNVCWLWSNTSAWFETCGWKFRENECLIVFFLILIVFHFHLFVVLLEYQSVCVQNFWNYCFKVFCKILYLKLGNFCQNLQRGCFWFKLEVSWRNSCLLLWRQDAGELSKNFKLFSQGSLRYFESIDLD